MKKALYLGVFDPITLGQLDILERAISIVDELIVGVVEQPIPTAYVGVEERMKMVKKAVSHIKNVTVVKYNGHLEEMIKKYDVHIIIKGLRMMSDFESEINIVHTNYNLNYDVDTVFMSTNEAYTNYSAKEIRLIAKNNGEISHFLPEIIIDDVKSIYA